MANSDEGDFDGHGWSYDGDLLPKAGPVTWDGVTYDAPEPTGNGRTTSSKQAGMPSCCPPDTTVR
ncbi:hypothetical protein GCM10023238_32100 [Streptomyces heliomycini]